ncbi:hypothetical protein JZX87_22895 [Agrobacterium sp. Ap1]|uniref:hypothetical protein n=1 Tax=Agrobacterium sp. Ap1 TaxID=2815337 RepID=UPI001A8E95EA|nr:hypothetical protein [Agrobacterium sp. Ap1]MBO0144007.1 hypothetical protein [Agrobacterium sp. Ap1]
MPKRIDEVHQADEELFRAVDEAIDQAVRAAGAKLQSLGVSAAPHDYFSDGALRHLFMRLCGADAQTFENGDPDVAWKILYAGRNVARRWERQQGRPASMRQKNERAEDIAKNQSERQQLARSAESFALRTVLRALMGKARATDPQIDARLQAPVDARAAELADGSEAELALIETARNYLALFTKSTG